MVRPATPRRGAGRTLQVLDRLQRSFGAGVEISIFGCDDDQLAQFGAPLGGAINHQRMDRSRMAWLLERSDVFLDLSDYQAMGLTALEAMASGCAVVAPVLGGAAEFVRNEYNGLIVDTTDLEECVAAAERLVGDAPLRQRLRMAAAADACLYPPEVAAYRMMEALFG
jgi:glycosyltransferase involved in cell wall biosynthesis